MIGYATKRPREKPLFPNDPTLERLSLARQENEAFFDVVIVGPDGKVIEQAIVETNNSEEEAERWLVENLYRHAKEGFLTDHGTCRHIVAPLWAKLGIEVIYIAFACGYRKGGDVVQIGGTVRSLRTRRVGGKYLRLKVEACL